MATMSGITPLKDPFPQFTVGGLGSLTLGRLNPHWHTDVPLPQFNPSLNGYPASTLPLIPIKPLPGTGGGGGTSVVGMPIDSG
jgi:hypothetical protein